MRVPTLRRLLNNCIFSRRPFTLSGRPSQDFNFDMAAIPGTPHAFRIKRIFRKFYSLQNQIFEMTNALKFGATITSTFFCFLFLSTSVTFFIRTSVFQEIIDWEWVHRSSSESCRLNINLITRCPKCKSFFPFMSDVSSASSSAYLLTSFLSPSVDMDLGLSKGRPRARSHTRDAHTPAEKKRKWSN